MVRTVLHRYFARLFPGYTMSAIQGEVYLPTQKYKERKKCDQNGDLKSVSPVF